MKVLFISGLYSNALKASFIENSKKGLLQNACDTFQWAVVEGLFDNNVDFYTFSYPFLPCFPFNYKKCIIPSDVIEYSNKVIGKSFSYYTLPILKDYSIGLSLKRNVSNWIAKNIKDNESFAVLTYTAEPFFIEPLSRLKKKYPRMIIASIVTDLVDDIFNFKSNLSLLKKIQSNNRIKRTKKGYDVIDKYILLTNQMEEKIPQSVGNNIIVEGIYKNSDNIKAGDHIVHSLLYTGALEEYAGVKLLVEAFRKTSSKDFKLIICGNGPLADYIKYNASLDSRIDFRGSVSRDEAVRLQKEVSLLINPRQPNGGITKYSFPSKTMEYMSSGTPMIGYRLEGMPAEYFDHMFIPSDLSLDALVESLVSCFNLSSEKLAEVGENARIFIQNNKTAKSQVKRIIDFIGILN